MKYDHKEIEKKWQEQWERDGAGQATENANKKKFYALIEFPYPSGDGLHVGHVRSNTAMDIVARKRRAEGYEVLYPIGWDAFGLPTENYAIKTGIQPAIVTKNNTDTFRRQLKALGFSFDWSREINTTDPAYYKWTQWIFLQMYKRGLAYKARVAINWCPKDKIGLANEEVINGCCERCGTPVEKREKEQWMLAITKYADRLDSDLDTVDYLEKIKIQQRNWIGRSIGAEISFPLRYSRIDADTTRMDADARSYVMGVGDISSELRSIGIEVATKTDSGNYQVMIPPNSIAAFETLISQKLRPGFWNEYVSNEDVVFIFKSKAGEIKRIVWNENDEAELLRLCNEYAGAQFQTIRGMLEGNEWYASHLPRRSASSPRTSATSIEVFTTRADTLFGATYLVLAPEHSLLAQLAPENKDEVDAYIAQAKAKTDMDRSAEGKEKTGIELKGVRAINPATQEEIPIYVADYVLGAYGTGAIMAVPAHDVRDFEFAEKFNLPVLSVIAAPRYVIFDFDGVIGDTLEASAHARLGFENIETLEQARQNTLDYASKKPRHARGHTLTPEQVEEEHEWTRKFGEAMVKHDFKLFEDFIDEILKIPNLQVAIVSSGSRAYVEPALERSRLQPSHILTFEDSMSKEEKIEILCRDWGVDAKDVYYFTDSKADVHELKDLLHPKRLVGCAWGYSGKEGLEEVLPREQVLENFADIHRVLPLLLYTGDGTLINSGTFDGLANEGAAKKITEFVGGKIVTKYKLRDWVFSRQRYWGEPIPMIHCAKDGWVPVPEDQLPVTLPAVEKYQPTDTGESPLAAIADWINTTCPSCGGEAKRETDVMPNWAGSSWYYLRYCDPHNDQAFAGRDKLDYWTPVDWYNGGMEHTVLHLLYSRFWHKFLFDEGLVPTSEPYAKRTSHGLILAEGGVKMSKSKGNVINPDSLVEQYGADSLRLYEMFMGPFDQAIAWNTDGVIGMRRFLDRVWRYADRRRQDTPIDADKETEKLLNETIRKVSDDIENLKMNTAVSALMILFNAMEKAPSVSSDTAQVFVRLLAPFAPHITEELWQKLGKKGSVHDAAWPTFDLSKTVSDMMHITLQINGKSRGTIEMPAIASEGELTAAARSEITDKLEGRTVVRTVVVPGRLVNFVLADS